MADHTFALILCLVRRILYCDRSLRERRWEYTKIMGVEIWNKTRPDGPRGDRPLGNVRKIHQPNNQK